MIVTPYTHIINDLFVFGRVGACFRAYIAHQRKYIIVF